MDEIKLKRRTLPEMVEYWNKQIEKYVSPSEQISCIRLLVSFQVAIEEAKKEFEQTVHYAFKVDKTYHKGIRLTNEPDHNRPYIYSTEALDWFIRWFRNDKEWFGSSQVAGESDE